MDTLCSPPPKKSRCAPPSEESLLPLAIESLHLLESMSLQNMGIDTKIVFFYLIASLWGKQILLGGHFEFFVAILTFMVAILTFMMAITIK